MSLVDLAADLAGDVVGDLIGDLLSPYVLLYSNARSLGGIIPHVTVREVLIDEDTVTQHPVESGTPVADHVFANPQLIEMEVGFSDSTAGYPGYVQDVYNAFLALKATREPFDVYTGKRAYSNMLFGNLQVVTDEASEHILMLTARMQQVIITDTDDSSGLDSSAQQDPQQTSPTTDVGNQGLSAAPAAPDYGDYVGRFGHN